MQCQCKFCSLCSAIQKTSIFLTAGCGFGLLRLHWWGEMWVFLLFNVDFFCSEFQESSYPDSPVHPHVCAGLRNPAGRDSSGHSLQHKEVNYLSSIWIFPDVFWKRDLQWPLHSLVEVPVPLGSYKTSHKSVSFSDADRWMQFLISLVSLSGFVAALWCDLKQNTKSLLKPPGWVSLARVLPLFLKTAFS